MEDNSMYKYNDIIFEDIEKKQKDGYNDWSGICQKCIDKYNINESMLDGSCGSGCCMVSGCENEADYYIDFEDGDITELSE